jgi:polyhydroxyalkanoate synthase
MDGGQPAARGLVVVRLADWLGARSGDAVAPPPLGRPDAGYPALADAPGEHVFMK